MKKTPSLSPRPSPRPVTARTTSAGNNFGTLDGDEVTGDGFAVPSRAYHSRHVQPSPMKVYTRATAPGTAPGQQRRASGGGPRNKVHIIEFDAAPRPETSPPSHSALAHVHGIAQQQHMSSPMPTSESPRQSRSPLLSSRLDCPHGLSTSPVRLGRVTTAQTGAASSEGVLGGSWSALGDTAVLSVFGTESLAGDDGVAGVVGVAVGPQSGAAVPAGGSGTAAPVLSPDAKVRDDRNTR